MIDRVNRIFRLDTFINTEATYSPKIYSTTSKNNNKSSLIFGKYSDFGIHPNTDFYV